MTDELLTRTLRVIPSGAQTWSKARSSWPAVAPTHLVRGRGAHVWSSDGREFIDLAIALGAVTLGYQQPDIEAAVADQLSDGPLFSLSHPLETDVAERLCDNIPPAEAARFFKTGSDATSAAVRVARAHTGRDLVLSSGYHGWHSWTCGNRAGIPTAVTSLTEPLGIWHEGPPNAAAVIVEPEAFHANELRELRNWCDRNGTVLIFDEVLTGFRVGSGGWQYLTGVTPDLTCLSKALGNGYSVAAVVGKREVMQTFEKVGVSGTFGGDTIGLAAAKAVLQVTESTDYYKRLCDVGGLMRQEFHRAAADVGIEVEAVGFMTHWIPKFKADDADVDPIIRDKRASLPWRTLWRQEMVKRGILIGPAYVFASAALSDFDVERYCEANREAFGVLASVDDPAELLVGEAAGGGIRAA